MRLFKHLVFHILKWLLAFFLLSSIGVTVFYKYVPVVFTPLMGLRLIEQARQGQELRFEHHWVPLERISSDLPVAVMASEDQNFLRHNGFDTGAIQQAAIERLNGKRRRGGSTISQQTAKNVFLWPASSWVRKGFEAYFTVLIEIIWGKRRIMEVYLNSIEMGRGLYGAEAVARTNFGCSAARLSRSECALIAATLPNPLRFDSAHPSRYMLSRRQAIVREMHYVRRTLPASAFKQP